MALVRRRKQPHPRTSGRTLPCVTDWPDLILGFAKDAIDQQRGALDELRARAGTVLAATAIAGSFLGTSLLESPDGLSFAFWAGLIGFAVSLVGTLFVLLPRKDKWRFGPNIQLLRDHYLDTDPDEARRELIKHMARWESSNDQTLTPLYAAFTGSTVALIGGLGFWIWEFARTSA